MKTLLSHRWPCRSLVGALIAAFPLLISAATLTNRYSFLTDARDSIGGKNGQLVNGPIISDGQLLLDGMTEQYVNLPNNLIVGMTAITIEAWITPSYNANWTRIWDFGNSNAGEDKSDYGTKHFMCYILPNLEATIYAGGSDSWIRSSPAFTLPNDQEAHIVWTSDAATRKARLYVNGNLVGKNDAAQNSPAALGSTFNNWLGRSQFSADPYFTGAFNEFRIWNGALNPLEVNASTVAGPDNVTTDPGAITRIVLQVAFQMVKGNSQQAVVLASAANLPRPVNIADINGIVYQSGDTNILTINATGQIRAVSAGSTFLTAGFQGQSDSQTITVIEQPARLTHRYSFTANANDSVGQAHGELLGGAIIENGRVLLDSSLESHVQLPAGILTSYQALTIECWATFGTLDTWSRLWCFGDQNDAGQGRYYVELCPHGGSADTYMSISDADPGGNHADSVAWATPLDNLTNVHVAAVFNPLAGYHALYVNGNLVGRNLDPAITLAGVKDTLNWIGRSLYAADPYLNGSVDEFRIYQGALSSLEIGVSHAFGPSTPQQNPGALQSISLQLSPTMIADSGQVPIVFATYANLTHFNLSANSLAGIPGLTYAFSDPEVAFLDADGFVRSGRPGSATVTATYQGQTSSVVITVVPPPPAILRHRYSFTENANDSVSGAHGALQGSARISAGTLVLDGSAGTYVELPGGLVSSLGSVTIEFWADFGPQPNWPRVFDFGSVAGNDGVNFLFFTPKTHFGAHRFGIATGTGYSDLDSPSALENRSLHMACVYDPNQGFQAVYTNGVLERAIYNARIPLSTVAVDLSYLGRSLFSADGYLNGSLDEFRIYEGRLTRDQVIAHFQSGPDQLARPELAILRNGESVILSWPLDAADFTLVASPVLDANAPWNPVAAPVIRENARFQTTLPLLGTQYYQLRK